MRNPLVFSSVFMVLCVSVADFLPGSELSIRAGWLPLAA